MPRSLNFSLILARNFKSIFREHLYADEVVVAVIGGVSLGGGRGEYVAVAIAAVFLTVLTSLLTALQIGEAGRQCIFGTTLLAFLAINGWSLREQSVRLRPRRPSTAAGPT